MQLGRNKPCPALETYRLNKQIEGGKQESRQVKVTRGVIPFSSSKKGVPIYYTQ